MTPMSLAARIAHALQSAEYYDKHGQHAVAFGFRQSLGPLAHECSSGLGVGISCTLNRDQSHRRALVFDTDVVHDGTAGTTTHRVVVVPAFDGLEIRVEGRDANDIRARLEDVFYQTLSA